MQIHLVAVGSHGDVLPILALGVELIRRGHGVMLAAPAPFEAMARRAGVPFHGLCTRAAYERAMREPDLWHPRRGVGTLFSELPEFTEQTYAWLAQRSRRLRETLVVASSLSLGARIAQDKLGLNVVTVHAMPLLVESRLAAPLLPGLGLGRLMPSRMRHWLGRGADRYVIGPAALPRLNALRARLGLGPVRRLRHWWNSPSRVLLMFPDWFAAPQADWLPQAVQTGFPIVDRLGDAEALSPALTAFLAQGSAPLVFTYGSAMRRGRFFFETATALCRRMGRRGILLAPQDGQVPQTLPEGLIHAPYAPLSALLPRSAALIHHGGIGTVAQALAAGIPQLIVPVAFDHFDEGERVRRLGLGATLSRRRFTPARAARRLDRLLASPEVARRCRLVRERMAGEDGVSSACDRIEAMMAG
ncbi:glycosyltransferase [Methylobacterium sp. J-068]|uniref:glycosyltransferase n=1 Tax=Methylobacterium sp. J-068 TaxID=2836649 RepID=UPI001FBBCBEB|nr:glycosyltransferase [Methylobacterium sp. J-068]MCJ2036871.1 glycosyltransferase [Methylobacterium sp. J-068]